MTKQKHHRYEDYDNYEDENEIDLVDLIFMLVRRWKLILLIAIPISISGFFYAATRPSVYKAETTLMVSSGMASVGIESSDISLNQKLVITYSEVAKSKSILKKLIFKYDLGTTPEGLSRSISISPVSDTEIIKMSYVSRDPKLAAAVINEFGNEFMNKITEVMNIRNVKVIEKAEIPSQPLPKKRTIILAAFIILGGMMGCGVAFIIEMLHKKLRKPSDIEKILGAPMLGMIPDFSVSEDKKSEKKGDVTDGK